MYDERIRRKEGERGNEKKFALKTISKFYPKIEPLYQGILHENILETRLEKGLLIGMSDLMAQLTAFQSSCCLPDMQFVYARVVSVLKFSFTDINCIPFFNPHLVVQGGRKRS